MSVSDDSKQSSFCLSTLRLCGKVNKFLQWLMSNTLFDNKATANFNQTELKITDPIYQSHLVVCFPTALVNTEDCTQHVLLSEPVPKRFTFTKSQSMGHRPQLHEETLKSSLLLSGEDITKSLPQLVSTRCVLFSQQCLQTPRYESKTNSKKKKKVVCHRIAVDYLLLAQFWAIQDF